LAYRYLLLFPFGKLREITETGRIREREMEDEDYNPHVENEKITQAINALTDYKAKYESLIDKYMDLACKYSDLVDKYTDITLKGDR
jgi:hypothetical protein